MFILKNLDPYWLSLTDLNQQLNKAVDSVTVVGQEYLYYDIHLLQKWGPDAGSFNFLLLYCCLSPVGVWSGIQYRSPIQYNIYDLSSGFASKRCSSAVELVVANRLKHGYN